MLRFKRKLILDIYDYSGNRLCQLYDSQHDISGQASDVFITGERNGWKELSFSLQKMVDTEEGPVRNFRLDYLKADYAIRAEDEKEVDWYLISEPRIAHNGFNNEVEVTAGHVAMLLKQKNLTLVFNDEEGNSVGTPAELLDVILQGTGWYPGTVTEFYEDNGVDIKRRTLTCDEKTGSFKMISDMCELFDAKPVYHGESYVPLKEDPGDMDTNYEAYCTLENGQYVQLTGPATYENNRYYRYKVRSVDILPMNPFSVKGSNGLPIIFQSEDIINGSEVIELHYGHNLSNVTRTQNTENIVTKLYAYGAYGDKTDGYCSIGECKHTEYTYTAAVSLAIGDYGLFTYEDVTGEHHKRFLVSGQPVAAGDVLVYSTLDAASKMYIYNNTKEYAYFCDDEYGGTYITDVGEPDGETEIVNESNFIMDFTYYHGIGLFTEKMLQTLAKNQRKSPELRQAAIDASTAFNDVESRLSEAIGNSDYCRLAPSAYGTDPDGYLRITLDTANYLDGVMYRSDYYENDANYFKWYCATELKSNGDSKNDNASVVYMVHATNPLRWEKLYLKTINDIPAYNKGSGYDIGDRVMYSGSCYECTAACQDDEWTSSHWRIVLDLEPETITLWSRADQYVPGGVGQDELFLFKSNTVYGYLGALESYDESIMLTIEDITKLNQTKHPTFFISKDDLVSGKPNISPLEFEEYAWCWVFDPHDDEPIDENTKTDIGWYGQNINGHKPSAMWFYNKTVSDLPANRWCQVFFSDDEEPIPYPYTYWYDWRNGKAYYAKEVTEPGIVVTEVTWSEIKYSYDDHVFDVWSDLVATYSDGVVSTLTQAEKDNMLVGIFPSYVEKVTYQVIRDLGHNTYYVWEQFNENDTATKTQERIGANFGAVWQQCRSHDRCYQGDYEEYLYTAPASGLASGRYAFKNPYGDYYLFRTEHNMANADTLLFNTTDGYLTQTTAAEGEFTVEKEKVSFDAVQYHPTNVLDGIFYEDGTIDEQGGTELYSNASHRSGYAKVYGGLTYKYDGGDNNAAAVIYVYNSKKVYQTDPATGEGKRYYVGGSNTVNTFPIDLNYGDTGFIRIVTQSDNYEEFRVYHPGYRNSIIRNEETYKLIPFSPTEKSQLKAIPVYVRSLRDDSDLLYLDLMERKKAAQDAVTALDYELADTLGDIYREGYWQDTNYVDGDEDRLYHDAAENLKQISRPEAQYDITFVDLYGANEHEDFAADNTLIVPWPDLNMAYAVHLVDPELSIDEWAFIDRIKKCYDKPWETEIEINTDLTTIEQHSFADVLENIANVARRLSGKQTIYDKAVVSRGSNGAVAAERLEGEINLNRLRFAGAGSSMQTDAKGNLLFEDVNGDGAMKLAGAGFAIASTKNADGDWIWRTFGTGNGFTADLITTGFLSADRIQAGSITVDKIENGLGSVIDLSKNSVIIKVQATKYDKYNGIVIDDKGITINTDLWDDIEYLPLGAKPGDWDDHCDNYYYYDDVTTAYYPVTSGTTYQDGRYYKQVIKPTGAVNNIVSLNKAGISLASNASINIMAGAGFHVKSGSDFTVDSTNLKIDGSGNATFTGTIYAQGGYIDGNIQTRGAKIIGEIEATSGKVGGFSIVNNTLYHSTPSTTQHIYLDGTDGLYAIWTGAAQAVTSVSGTTVYAPFSVTKTGILRATGAIISGDITANTGHIGGWEIDSSGFMHAGATTNYVALDPRTPASTYPYVMWAGAAAAQTTSGNTTTYAPFSVTKAGVLRATGAILSGQITATTGQIGGWWITSTALQNASSNATVGMSSTTTGTSVAFWAGGTTSNAKFRVTAAGNVTIASDADISGKITASSGFIGNGSNGFTIGNTFIRNGMTALSDTTNNGVYVGTDGIALGKGAFKVTNTGSATVSGNITATSGKIAGWTIDGNVLKNTYTRTGTSTQYITTLDAAGTTGSQYVYSLKLVNGTIPMPGVLDPSSTVNTAYVFGVTNSGQVEATGVVAYNLTAYDAYISELNSFNILSNDITASELLGATNFVAGTVDSAGNVTPTVVIEGTSVQYIASPNIRLRGTTGEITCTTLSATSEVTCNKLVADDISVEGASMTIKSRVPTSSTTYDKIASIFVDATNIGIRLRRKASNQKWEVVALFPSGNESIVREAGF